MASVSLVVINEGEGQGDVEGVGSAGCRCSLPCFKCNGEIHPSGRAFGFEALDEVVAKDLTQHGLKSQVNTHCSIGAA